MTQANFKTDMKDISGPNRALGHHLAFLDSSNTMHDGSINLDEATLIEKPLEWMKVKRNQADKEKSFELGHRIDFSP
ncbi:hypothetical protein HF521_006292 [Silurus meridionalis]|uniref:Uncharacterized protein n=1 Tax=Silurus meridionalis TaxID=175797 RepID=A0A8T0AVN1_SILME|nr:hypothetical protein HF521_006292 [Silurus meridionalis]